MSVVQATLSTLADTRAAARGLAAFFSAEAAGQPERAQFAGFCGPLGVGKTELIRELLRALGVTGDVTSPTFVFECVYLLPESAFSPAPAGPIEQIVHWDLYRWNSPAVPQDFFDYRRSPRTLVLVEWPERSADLLDLLDIKIMLAFPGSSAGEIPAGAEIASREVEVSFRGSATGKVSALGKASAAGTATGSGASAGSGVTESKAHRLREELKGAGIHC